MKYYYVVLGSDTDYYKASYADLNNRADAIYLSNCIDTKNKIIEILYRIHTSSRINKYFNLPLQGLWNKFLFHSIFNEEKPLCFIFSAGRDKDIKNGLPFFLRKKYSGCRLVLFYQDLVKRTNLQNVCKMKRDFDIILSFDHHDAAEYSIDYYPLVYSKVSIPDNNSIKDSDIYFVGKAKDRLETILAVFKKCKDAGLICDFHIIGVDKSKRKYTDDIIYQDQMPYLENLQRIQKCKCMLEVMQGGGYGFTLRYGEAIMYDKRLITNNLQIKDAPFFSPKIIQTFQSVEDICPEFAKAEPQIADYHYKDQLSPIRLLNYIDKKF